MTFGTGEDTVRITVLDDIGSSGEVIHYTFEDGTGTTASGFRVTPSDTGAAITVNTGAVTSTGTITENDVAIWNADGTQLSGQPFEELLNDHSILIETDIPPLVADLQADFEYTFRIYTRGFQSEDSVVAANFELLNTLPVAPARADAGNAGNPTQIGPNAAQVFRVSWDANSVRQYQDNQAANNNTLTRPAVIVPGISPDPVSPFLATHDVGLGSTITDEQTRILGASTSTQVQDVISQTE